MQSSSALTISNYFRTLFALLIISTLLSGCATVNGVPCGALYSNINGPLLITDGTQAGQVGYNQVASSKSHSLFYMINWGDASIKNALGTKLVTPGVSISHIDFKYTQLLGCGTYTTIVYYYDPTYHGEAVHK